MADHNINSIEDIADRIDPRRAQIALAEIMVALGAYAEWSSEHVEWVAASAGKAAKTADLPSFTDQDDEAVEFWEAFL